MLLSISRADILYPAFLIMSYENLPKILYEFLSFYNIAQSPDLNHLSPELSVIKLSSVALGLLRYLSNRVLD